MNDTKNKDHWTTCQPNVQGQRDPRVWTILDKNYYTNLKYLHLCFPIGFRKLTNAAKDLDPNLVPVNNFFVHWIKEIDITNYGTNKNLIPNTTPQEVYRYSDAMLKYLQENICQNDLLFSKKVVVYPPSSNRRSHNNDDATKRTDDNSEDQKDKFAVQIDSKYVYSIPLKYFYDLGNINFPTKIDLKIPCTLETKIKKIIWIEKKVTIIGAPDAQIVFLKAPLLQYE